MENCFLVERTTTERPIFQDKLPCQKPMIRQTKQNPLSSPAAIGSLAQGPE